MRGLAGAPVRFRQGLAQAPVRLVGGLAAAVRLSKTSLRPAQAGGPNCFLAGTLIATPDGEVRVETLETGQHVTTASGRTKPVRWLARRVERKSPDASWRRGVGPVRVKKDALGPGLPHEDLYVSGAMPC